MVSTLGVAEGGVAVGDEDDISFFAGLVVGEGDGASGLEGGFPVSTTVGVGAAVGCAEVVDPRFGSGVVGDSVGRSRCGGVEADELHFYDIGVGRSVEGEESLSHVFSGVFSGSEARLTFGGATAAVPRGDVGASAVFHAVGDVEHDDDVGLGDLGVGFGFAGDVEGDVVSAITVVFDVFTVVRFHAGVDGGIGVGGESWCRPKNSDHGGQKVENFLF